MRHHEAARDSIFGVFNVLSGSFGVSSCPWLAYCLAKSYREMYRGKPRLTISEFTRGSTRPRHRIASSPQSTVHRSSALSRRAGDRIPLRRQSRFGACCPGTRAGWPHPRAWRAYYSLSHNRKRTIRKVRIGEFPAIGLAEARRRAAEVIEAVERGRGSQGDEKVRGSEGSPNSSLSPTSWKIIWKILKASDRPKHVRDVRNALTIKRCPARPMHPRDIKSTDIQRL